MAAVAVEGTAGECVRTPSPGTQNGVTTGSTERQHPKADGTGSERAGSHSKVIGDGAGPKGMGAATCDQGQHGREEQSALLPNGVPSTVNGAQAGAAGKHPESARATDSVQLRHQSSGSPDRSRSRPMSFRLWSQHGLLLTEEMKVEGEKMVVRLGEESIVWESAKIGKGVWCVCACAVMSEAACTVGVSVWLA